MPDFRLTGNRSNIADLNKLEIMNFLFSMYLFLFHGVDHRRFSYVRIADETNRNRFLVLVQKRKLSKKRNQRSLAKWICNGRMERLIRLNATFRSCYIYREWAFLWIKAEPIFS